eukprot:6192156-Pleurochrysis_carterae.AAC.1
MANLLSRCSEVAPATFSPSSSSRVRRSLRLRKPRLFLLRTTRVPLTAAFCYSSRSRRIRRAAHPLHERSVTLRSGDVIGNTTRVWPRRACPRWGRTWYGKACLPRKRYLVVSESSSTVRRQRGTGRWREARGQA